jgi:hypothetical protein
MSHHDPLDATTIGILGLWADAQPDHAKVSISTLRTVLRSCVQLRRQNRDLKAECDAAWAMVAADCSDAPTDFPKDT